ncbi:MAG: glycosyltransferase [Candidatus Aminicenantes bacterium RBG_16_63_16]|nr:MAG: glycosyltransferase [Candidatus Aminicenantes bacterium RBG_16_63_16]
MRPRFSIIVPVYQAEACLLPLHERLVRVLDTLPGGFEIILVEDGGRDASWTTIEKICRSDPRVKGVKLSRNFGQHSAITAGLDRALGDLIVIMDCDLQDLPEAIPPLYAKAVEGFDIVLARRSTRNDPIFRRIASRAFYALLGYLTDTPQDAAIANFGMYSRRAVEAVMSMREHLRYFPAMIRWVGFRSATADVEHAAGSDRRSSYTLRKLLHLALDVVLSFSEKPLRLVIKLGFALSFLSIVWALVLLLRAVIVRQSVPGWSSLIVSVWFLSGLIVFVLGVVGIYVGKVFEQVKHRPLYIVEKTVSVEGNEKRP